MSHFTLAELCRSDVATRHLIDNRPPDAVMPNLRRLIETLERIRAALGDRPVIVTSGYRSPDLNSKIGGSRSSAHMDGRAADIQVVGLHPRAVALGIAEAGIRLDQLIYEGHWAHVGIHAENVTPRGDILTARFSDNGVRYVRGIV